MTTDERLVSIIIPSFNRGPVLEAAIESAFRQTYPEIEVVVVDDGSTDDTMARLERITSPKLKVLSIHRNMGPARARNLGIANSRGAYIAFLDSDDTWEPWKIEAQMERFRAGGAAVGAVYCGRRVRLADGAVMEIRPKVRGRVFGALLRRNTVPLPTLMVRRSVLTEIGSFDPDLPACEDWDLVLRIAQRYTFDFVAEPAVHYSGSGADRMSARARAVFIANHRIFRRYSDREPKREVLAAYLALQSRELLHLGRSALAARYALRSLKLAFDLDERIALRTLRQLMLRRPLGRMLVEAYGRRGALIWR